LLLTTNSVIVNTASMNKYAAISMSIDVLFFIISYIYNVIQKV